MQDQTSVTHINNTNGLIVHNFILLIFVSDILLM